METATQWMEIGGEMVLQSADSGSRIHFNRPGFARCACGTFLPRPYTHCVATIASSSELETPTGPMRLNAKWVCLECIKLLFSSLRNAQKEATAASVAIAGIPVLDAGTG